MKLFLLEDSVAREWEPFSLTRPIGELLYGALGLRERVERALGTPAHGYLAPHLAGYSEGDACATVANISDDTGPVALLSSRYVPPLLGEQGHDRLAATLAGAGERARLLVGSEPMGWLAASGAELAGVVDAVGAEEEAPSAGPGRDVALPGKLLATPWELMAGNADRLAADLAAWSEADSLVLGDGVSLVGAGRVSTSGAVTVDPGCVLDTRDGPIHLAAGVHLRPFSYVRGPALIGPGTTLFGGTFEALSVGPGCKLRGEIAETVFLGYANKAHDGYIGHSVIGRWVNLGAFTTNSDLKNNYGEIRVGSANGSHSTGMIKVGVFLGDHVKTGIGTRLNGGTVVGAGSNLYGAAFPPRWIPPFHWGTGEDLVPHRLESFLETAERAMGRRDVILSPSQKTFLTRAWERVHGTPS